MFYKLTSLLVLAVFLGFSSPVSAQDAAPEQKCEGDPQMCAHIADLQKTLKAQKEIIEKSQTDKTVAVKEEEKKKDAEAGDEAGKMIAFAATFAVALKLLVSTLSAWKGFFRSDKAKAWLKVSLVVGGFLVFVATNLGFGIPWWQALILAGGGPGSILVHELGKLIPVFRGQKKYEEVDPDGDPTADSPPPAVLSFSFYFTYLSRTN